MRFKNFIVIAILALAATLTGCAPPDRSAPQAHAPRVADTNTAVTERQVRNSNDSSMLFWYIIYSNTMTSSCPCYVASSPTAVSNVSSLDFSRVAAVPPAAGNSENTKVEQEQTQQEPNESLPSETQEVQEAQAETEVTADTAADPTDGIGDGPNDNSMSEGADASSDSYDAGDSGGGDYGGGDSGGGDSGGGGGE